MLTTEPIEQFLTALAQQRDFSGHTLAAYRNDLTQFADFLGSDQGTKRPSVNAWTEVTRDHVVAFLLHLKERGYAPTTVARKQAAVKSYFKYLVSRGALSSNPSENIESQHVDRAVPHTISSSEADRLITEIDRQQASPEAMRDRAMMHLMYDTGLRVSEMVALDTRDVDLDAGTVTVVARGKERKVPIASRVSVALLREYLDRGRPTLLGATHSQPQGGASLAGKGRGREVEAREAPLFLNHRGQRLTRQGFWLILKRYAERAGLGAVSPHTLRHSFAAQKLKSGTDVRDLQRVLGHASISTTQVYARLGEGKSSKRS
jgi:integrase/recombinase XerD